jgi:hypothetical protein
MRFLTAVILCLLVSLSVDAQDPELARLVAEKGRLEKEVAAVTQKIEDRKLENVQNDLRTRGLPALQPGEEVVISTSSSRPPGLMAM